AHPSVASLSLLSPPLPPGTTRSCWSRGQTRREGRQGTLTHPINSAAQTHRSSLREHGLRNKSSNSLRTGRIDLRPHAHIPSLTNTDTFPHTSKLTQLTETDMQTDI